MLPKINRLRLTKDFKRLYQKSKTYHSPLFILRFLPNNLEVSRFAFIVSLKISKKATQRNKIKRWFRHIIRLNLKKIKPGLDIIIIAKAKILEKEFRHLEEGLTKALKELKLLT